MEIPALNRLRNSKTRDFLGPERQLSGVFSGGGRGSYCACAWGDEVRGSAGGCVPGSSMVVGCERSEFHRRHIMMVANDRSYKYTKL